MKIFFLFFLLLNIAGAKDIIGKCRIKKAVLKIELINATTDYFQLKLESGDIYSLTPMMRNILSKHLYLDTEHKVPLETKFSSNHEAFFILKRNDKNNQFVLDFYEGEEKRTLLESLSCE